LPAVPAPDLTVKCTVLERMQPHDVASRLTLFH
jgi:hypothetical protein